MHFREIAARRLSVRDVWRIKSLSEQLRSARKSIPMASGAELRLPEEREVVKVTESFEMYLVLLWTLLLGCAFAGIKPLDTVPASRSPTEDCVEDSIDFVECPLDVLQACYYRAKLNARKAPYHNRLACIVQRDVAERTKWVELHRSSKMQLGRVNSPGVQGV